MTTPAGSADAGAAGHLPAQERAGPATDQPGRVALVTGASRGIGRALVEDLLAEGWAVGALARDALSLRGLGHAPGSRQGPAPAGAAEVPTGAPSLPVQPLVADVTEQAQLDAAVVALTRRWHAPDLVVANAGVLAAAGPTWQTDPQAWARVLAVNVTGAYLTLRATLPAMVARGSGRAIVVASSLGIRPAGHLSAYGASKAAVIHLVSSLAQELAGTGVSVFAVSPGMVRTDMTQWPEELLAHRPEMGQFPDSAYAPIGAVTALVRDLASGRFDALSGRFLHVTDDRHALLAATQ